VEAVLSRRIRYGGVIAGREEINAAAAVLAGQDWACGPVTAEFEAAAAAAQGRAHALFVNSGSSALLLALATLPRGSRVAMPALQFPTLYSAALWCGHVPVLVDVDDSLNMDPDALAGTHAGQRVDAVAFVHMAGNPSNAAEIARICGDYALPLVEDICEALGAAAGGIRAGNSGHVSATSTHAAHQISTGEGGLVFTDDAAAYGKMRRIRDWGRAYGTADIPGYYDGYVFAEAGLNLHASDIQAALGLVQLRRLDGFVEARRRNWAVLQAKTQGLPFGTPRADPGCQPSWYTFPMLAADQAERDRLAGHLAAAGIESRPVVAGNMARQPVCAGEDPARFPVADEVFRRGLWVSVHPALTGDGLAYIADTLAAFWE
jgi:dTDP-4-amino-4,6-dideoxygalactose transaminase